MNYLIFLSFITYVVSALIAGTVIYSYLNRDNKNYFNRSVYLGETFLLGNIPLIGGWLLLSLVGLYRGPCLWGLVVLNYLFLLHKDVREQCGMMFRKKTVWDVPLVLFFILAGVFIFRNIFYMMDVDSHDNYLFTQKLWLATGSSLQGDVARTNLIFFPQFDAMPYGLGIALFGQDTLFAQLVNTGWRLVAVLLVFGYVSSRLDRFAGLAASMLVLFNDHFFYSGANKPVIINGAMTALLFAVIYNFWEARRQNSSFRFILALIFATQVMANKYQMAFTLFFLLILGFFMQPNLGEKIRHILRQKRWWMALGVAVLCAALWYIKNFLITEWPTFPLLAGRFHVWNYTPEQEIAFMKVFGRLSPSLILKYLNYLFIWPGINAAKYTALGLSFFPLLIVFSILRNKMEKEALSEAAFWLGLSVVMIIGTCLAVHWGPTYYRFSSPVFAAASVYFFNYFLRHCLGLKKPLVIGLLLLLLALPGYKIIFAEDGPQGRPFFKDNWGILLNRVHFADVVDRYYPANRIAAEEFNKNSALAMKSAWDIGLGMCGNTPLSAFLLPTRPQVGLWHTSVINWKSYEDPKWVVQDLKKYGLERIMRMQNDKLVFLTLEEYAQEAVRYDRFPKSLFFDYGFPKELSEIKY